VYPPAEPKSSAPGFVGSTGIGETEKSLTNSSDDTFPETLARPRVDGCMPRAAAISCTRAIPSDVRQDLRKRMAMFIEALIISPYCKRAAFAWKAWSFHKSLIVKLDGSPPLSCMKIFSRK
jgi:hypothetical protein